MPPFLQMGSGPSERVASPASSREVLWWLRLSEAEASHARVLVSDSSSVLILTPPCFG